MSQYPNVFLASLSIHPSWAAFFANYKVQMELEAVEKLVSKESFTPTSDLVLRFASVDLLGISCIIVGKDVYPQKDVATGRSFEVSGVTSWFDPRVNSSLKNIIKLIHKSYNNQNTGSSIAQVREDIDNGNFPILPPHEAFSYWERNGALFLNTAFTCRVGGFEQAGSHLAFWKKFFDLLLSYIAEQNKEISYFLWGDARKYAKKLDKLGIAPDRLYLAKHPCTNGDSGGYQNKSSFLNCACFRDTQETVKWV